jgi:nicotinate-nucleotide adenylyltransferase
MRIGLFGGTFDPIHLGHLDVARAARQALTLDEVWVVPARVPPHRSTPHASAAHRFAMTALAVEDEAGLRMSDVEMESDGPSYTTSTLDRLEAAGANTRALFLITGADAFKDIRSWKGYPALIDRCHIVVVSRPGYAAARARTEIPELADRMHETPCTVPAAPSIFLVDAPTAPVSSTGVRRAIADRESLDALVPPRVAAYIVRHGLYGGAGPVGSRKGHA